MSNNIILKRFDPIIASLQECFSRVSAYATSRSDSQEFKYIEKFERYHFAALKTLSYLKQDIEYEYDLLYDFVERLQSLREGTITDNDKMEILKTVKQLFPKRYKNRD